MSEWQLKLKEWWSNLGLREQRTVAIGGIVVGVLIFYVLIWGPYLDRLEAMRKSIQINKKTLAWMQVTDKEIKQLQSQGKPKAVSVTPVELLSVLQTKIDEKGLAPSLTQMKQATQDSIELHFKKVDFDKLIALLMTIMEEQNVQVTRLSANADTTPGMVDSDIIISISGTR